VGTARLSQESATSRVIAEIGVGYTERISDRNAKSPDQGFYPLTAIERPYSTG
jgi:hypothetical protein